MSHLNENFYNSSRRKDEIDVSTQTHTHTNGLCCVKMLFALKIWNSEWEKEKKETLKNWQ